MSTSSERFAQLQAEYLAMSATDQSAYAQTVKEILPAEAMTYADLSQAQQEAIDALTDAVVLARLSNI